MSFWARMTCAELETGNNSAAPWITARKAACRYSSILTLPTTGGRGRRSHLLGHLVELQVVQVPVQRVMAEQFLVDAGRRHAPLVEQDQLVARADGRDAVRQKDRRPPRQEARQRVVEQRLGVVV